MTTILHPPSLFDLCSILQLPLPPTPHTLTPRFPPSSPVAYLFALRRAPSHPPSPPLSFVLSLPLPPWPPSPYNPDRASLVSVLSLAAAARPRSSEARSSRESLCPVLPQGGGCCEPPCARGSRGRIPQGMSRQSGPDAMVGKGQRGMRKLRRRT